MTAAVAGIFLLGLAIGSIWGGRVADHLVSHKSGRRLVWFYIALELLILFFAILNLQIFLIFTQIPGWWRIFIAGFLVLLHSGVSGVTWPVMFKILLTQGSDLNVSGKIAFVNTLGGAVGAFSSSFLLISNIGIFGTLLVGIGGNALAAALVFTSQLVARDSVTVFKAGNSQEEAKSATNSNAGHLKTILLTLFIAGFVGMALEIFWMRIFALVFGGSIYSFSLVLTVILFGLALGGLFAGNWLKTRLKISTLVWVLFIEAIFVLIGTSLVTKVPYFLTNQAEGTGNLFIKSQLMNIIFILITIFPASFFSGLLLPAGIMVLKTKFQKAGKIAGLLYAVNTVGAVLGGFAAAIILLPTFGLKNGTLLSAVLIGVFAPLFYLQRKDFIRSFVLFIFLGLFGIFGLKNWDEYSLSSGAFLYGREVLKPFAGIKLLSYKDGQEATISTTWQEGMTAVRINGKADASSDLDMGTQAVLGHVPILLHENPKKVLVIGLGSGVTSGAIARHAKVEELVTVEIEPAMVEAAKKYFSEENYGVLDDSKMKLVIGDGRNYLLTTSKQFDVITSEPSNPWQAGENNLFTKEFFELGKSKLTQDGVFFQWLHLYNLRPAEVKSILKTFTSVFPYVQVWTSTNPVDIFLAGKKTPFVLQWDRFQEALSKPGVRESLARRGFADEIRLFSLLWAGNNRARILADGGEVNSDLKPILEYRAPYGFYENTLPANFSLLLDIFQDDFDLFKIEGIPDDKREDLLRARYSRKFLIEGKKNFIEGDFKEAARFVEAGLAKDDASPHLKRFLAEVYFKMGRYSESIQMNPDYYPSYISLAQEYFEKEEKEQLKDLLSKSHELFPWSGTMRMYEGILAGVEGDSVLAEKALLEAKELEPWNPLIYNNLAHLYNKQGRRDMTMEAWEASLKLNPDQPAIQEFLRSYQRFKNLK